MTASEATRSDVERVEAEARIIADEVAWSMGLSGLGLTAEMIEGLVREAVADGLAES